MKTKLIRRACKSTAHERSFSATGNTSNNKYTNIQGMQSKADINWNKVTLTGLQTFLPRDALKCKARYCDRMSSVCPSVRPSVRPSVCLSVTLVNCDHIGWNSSKIISPIVSLGCSLFATPTRRVCSKGNTPKFGLKVTHHLLIWASETFDHKLRPNGYR